MPSGVTFDELIHRVRHRDEEAAAELVRRYGDAVRRVVRIRLRDARLRRLFDSTDVCQSVLASFFVRTALGQYEVASADDLLKLLATIARNKLANQANRLKAQRRDVRREMAECDAIPLVDRATSPEDQVAAKELLEKIRTELPAEERYLADQRSLGRSWGELAKELGGTEVALRKRLSRALDKLLIGLGIEGPENV